MMRKLWILQNPDLAKKLGYVKSSGYSYVAPQVPVVEPAVPQLIDIAPDLWNPTARVPGIK